MEDKQYGFLGWFATCNKDQNAGERIQETEVTDERTALLYSVSCVV
jgi:hypothetical protein